MDYKRVVTREDFHNDYKVYDRKSAISCNSKEELMNKILESSDEIMSKIVSSFMNDNVDIREFAQIIKDYCGWEHLEIIPVREESFIVPNTMFLTKAECKEHIERNVHHYTSKAHTYAMTAWRAPKVERLLNILSSTPWDYVLELESNKYS